MISLVLGKAKFGEIWKIWFIPNIFHEVSEWVYICSNLFSPSYSQLSSQSSGLDFQRRTWRSKCSRTTCVNPMLYKLCVCMWGMCVHESITLSPPAPFHRPPWVPIPDQGPYTDICCWLTQKVPVSSPAEVLWAPGLAAGGCCPLVAEPMPHGMGRHVLKRVVLGSLGLGCGCRAVAGTPACQLHQLCPSTRALRITWGPGEAWRVCVPWASECRRGQGSHLAIRDTSSAFPLGPGETQCV